MYKWACFTSFSWLFFFLVVHLVMFARLALTLVCVHLEVTVLMVHIVLALLGPITRDFEISHIHTKIIKISFTVVWVLLPLKKLALTVHLVRTVRLSRRARPNVLRVNLTQLPEFRVNWAVNRVQREATVQKWALWLRSHVPMASSVHLGQRV